MILIAKLIRSFFHAVLIFLLINIAACSSTNLVESREQYWKQKLEAFHPVGKSLEELFNWQKENNVRLNSFPYKEGIVLETIKGDGLICSTWQIFLSVELDSDKKISNYSVTKSGTCL